MQRRYNLRTADASRVQRINRILLPVIALAAVARLVFPETILQAVLGTNSWADSAPPSPASAEEVEVFIAVEGLTWPVGWPARVKVALESVPETRSAVLDFDAAWARVVVERGRLDPEALVRALEDAGFGGRILSEGLAPPPAIEEDWAHANGYRLLVQDLRVVPGRERVSFRQGHRLSEPGHSGGPRRGRGASEAHRRGDLGTGHRGGRPGGRRVRPDQAREAPGALGMRLACKGCGTDVAVPAGASEGDPFECPNWAGTTLRFRRNPDRLEIVPRASCPRTGEAVLLPEDVRPGAVLLASCGHTHRATFE